MAGPSRNRPSMRRRVGSASARHNDAVSASNGLLLSKIAPIHVMLELRNASITYWLSDRKRRAPPTGRRATAHWPHCAALAEAYPQISVVPDVMYIDEGSILTSGGHRLVPPPGAQ